MSLLQVQQLHGLLNFAIVALPVGNVLLFSLRRLLAEGCSSDLHPRARVLHSAPAAADLRLFRSLLDSFNGKDIFTAMRHRKMPFDLVTDASIYGGCAWFGGNVLTWTWSRVHESADMAVLEARVLRLALEAWAAALHSNICRVFATKVVRPRLSRISQQSRRTSHMPARRNPPCLS